MMKVRFKRAEYNAGLPPYRFHPGDVIEVDDDWAKQLVQRGIARKAASNAQTVQEIRAEEHVVTEEETRQDIELRRADLQAQLAALDREEARQPFGGHFSDMIAREDVTGDDEPADEPAAPRRATARPAASRTRAASAPAAHAADDDDDKDDESK